MAGRQIRWQSVGRAAAIAAALIAGIVALPALLGSDKPPPVPHDVGLTPPSGDAPIPPTAEPPAPGVPAAQPRRRHHRLAKRRARTEPPHRRGGPPHPRRDDQPRADRRVDQEVEPIPAPASPAYSPPAYSYVPPEPGEFQFER